MARQGATTGNVPEDFGDLKQDIDQLRSDLLSLTQHIKEMGGSLAADAKKAGVDRVDELRNELERTARQLKLHGEASVAEVERTIQERPLLSLAAAFGIGMLITKLLERR